MRFLKRIIALATCSVITATTFSGCSAIFGSFNNNGCKHNSGTMGHNERTHYKTCNECGEKYDVGEHELQLSYSANNKTHHYMGCLYCSYATSYEPHEFSNWAYKDGYSTRKCTVNGCKFEDKCTHDDMEYVISDNGHYLYCGHCEKTISAQKAHVYNNYTDVTETTHTLACDCGQKKGEPVTHELNLKETETGFHAEVCSCGFKKNEEACSFGDLISNKERHYKRCSKCNARTQDEKHTYVLTADRKRVCTVCDKINLPEQQLIGTWEVNYKYVWKHSITISYDWSYSVTDNKGNVVAQGDYYINSFQTDRNDNYVGQIVFSGYEDSPLNFTMLRKITSSFTDSSGRIYTKA